jgi:hypothetical protein
MSPLVFLDTETDGVHPDRKVWEVAMIRRDEQGEREASFFVEIDLSTADPFGLKVGRFYDRHPLGRSLARVGATLPAPDDKGGYLYGFSAAVTVAQWTHGAHIVGAVPNFDTEVLTNLLRANQLAPAWHYHLIDVENLAIGWVYGSGPSAPIRSIVGLPWDSEAVSRACGVEPPSEEERHTALGDARWAMRLYDAITGTPDA